MKTVLTSLATAALGLVVGQHFTPPAPGTVKATRLEVVDQSGRPRIVLDGKTGQLEMLTHKGEAYLEAGRELDTSDTPYTSYIVLRNPRNLHATAAIVAAAGGGVLFGSSGSQLFSNTRFVSAGYGIGSDGKNLTIAYVRLRTLTTKVIKTYSLPAAKTKHVKSGGQKPRSRSGKRG